MADPRAAIEGLSGSELPAAITIEVHEDSATSFHLVLPPSGKLAEEELATVFAGNWLSGGGGGDDSSSNTSDTSSGWSTQTVDGNGPYSRI